MKGIDLFCASPASTAICVSIDQRSMVLHGSRAIDRHNPHLGDGRRSRALNPCSSQPPTKSKPYHQKSRKSSAKSTDLVSPPGSSRYLLGDTSFFDVLSEFDPVSALTPVGPPKPRFVDPHESPALKPSSSSLFPALKSSSSSSSFPALKPSSSSSSFPALKPSSSSTFPALKSSSPTPSHDQVVVLRVSLHCKGCEGKLRKHLSRMEGVTSFSIDFETKKVTVIGDVTPLGVLASVSRVKNAQFWPSSSPSSSSSLSVGSSYRPIEEKRDNVVRKYH